ncbi:MAG: glycosyltransferase [Alphaproteobacteria bacterium]|nr:glycosyltransferase [Alphaproteobacteria bacterium]
MRVLFIDTKPFNPNRYIARGVFDALRADPRVVEAVWAEYADAVPLALAQPFDLLFAFDGEEARNPVISRLLELIQRKLVWFTEDPYERGVNLALSRHFDLVFTNDGSSAAYYDNRGIHLPLAGDPQRNRHAITDQKPRYDVFFGGTAWPNRLKFLAELKRRRPDLRCKFVLVSNPALDPHIEGMRDGFEFTPGVSIGDFCRLANASRVTLTLPRKFSTSEADPETASDTPGPRFFEVALAGACPIVDAETTSAAASLFTEGVHYLGFRTMDDCLAQIETALADEPRRRAIARDAQTHVGQAHLYRHRVAAMLDRVAALETPVLAPAPARQRPRVLFVAHNIVQHGRFGGAETYLEAIRARIGTVDPWILVPDNRKIDGRRFLLYDRDLVVRDSVTLGAPYAAALLTHPELEIFFQKLLAEHRFEQVHFNHLLGFPPSLPIIARAMGATTLYSLHDYFPICERFNLLGPAGRYCEIDRRPPATCDICLKQTQGLEPGSQARRRRFMRDSLAAIDVVLAGSAASAALLQHFYLETAARTHLLPPPVNAAPPRPAPREAGPLKVAHLGNFGRHKGADTILEVIARCQGQPVEFHIFGRVDPDFLPLVEKYTASSVTLHGSFSGGTLPAALADCDVMLFLSTWPETYGITLSEAQLAGLVPIVTNLGAQAERVRDGETGFLVEIGDALAVTDIVLTLAQDRTRLNALRAAQPLDAGIGADDFIAGLEALYAGLPPQPAAAPAETRRLLSLEEYGVFLDSPTWTQRSLYGFSLLSGPRGVGFMMRRFVAVARTDGMGLALRMARNKLRQIAARLRPA